MRRHKAQLHWGTTSGQKEELLRRSWQWLALRGCTVLLLALLVVAVPVGLVRFLSPTFLSIPDAQAMIKENGYYHGDWNPYGTGIQQEDRYKLQTMLGKQIVLDHTKELTWEQSGSKDRMLYVEALAYVDSLNQANSAGFRDWRLPTLDEAMSLVEPEQNEQGLFIASVFDSKQGWIWTSDEASASSMWSVNFDHGYCGSYSLSVNLFSVRAVC